MSEGVDGKVNIFQPFSGLTGVKGHCVLQQGGEFEKEGTIWR
jgi:hypothetical protein